MGNNSIDYRWSTFFDMGYNDTYTKKGKVNVLS